MAGASVPNQPSYPGSGGQVDQSGRTQIVGGQTYTMYTPAWYAAMDANKIKTAGVAGTAAGTAGANALSAMTGGAATSAANALTNVTGGGVGAPGVSGPGVSPGAGGGISPMGMPDTSAADAASLNRTKDTVGKQSAGALRGLRESLGARGMLGSGLESSGTEKIAEAGLGEQGDVARQQQIDNSNRAQHTAEVNYQGGIAMRGQDLNAQQEAARQRQAALTGLMSFINSSGSLY